MDRQAAGVHYISQAEFAFKNVLDWCNETYGTQAADLVAKMFTDLVFAQNLLNYTDMGEVLSLWAAFSKRPVTVNNYGAEFIIAFNQYFNMFVEPAVIASSQDVQALHNLTPLGQHLVGAIARNHSLVSMPTDKFHDDLSAYIQYMQDVPKPNQVIEILSYFPWMAPLYLLSMGNPLTFKAIVASYIIRSNPNQTGAGAQ